MRIAVIGAGSWGTAIAQLLARNGHDVRLWAHREKVARGVNEAHRNPDYLSDEPLDEAIEATTSLPEALRGAHAAAIVTPSRLVRGMARSLAGIAADDLPIVACSKGVEAETGMTPVEELADELGNPTRLAALCGPNHAEEVVRGVPAATVVASSSDGTARFFQTAFASEAFRVYTSDDVAGVELCAASKNVMAIAVGVSYGLGFGDNTAAMIMTRGLAEMSRLVKAAGGSAITCMGLAGAGDLVATCMSRHSRNRRFGEAVASGVSVEEFEASTHMVAEGALACKTLGTLARRYEVEMPITDTVRAVVWEGADPHEAGRALISRPPKPEFYDAPGAPEASS